MTRDEKIARAYGLRYVGGMLHREIAAELGVSEYTVSVYLNPEAARRYAETAKAGRRAQQRVWQDANTRALCACGRPMCVGSKYKSYERCMSCYRKMQRDGQRAGDMLHRKREDRAIVEAWSRMLADGSSIADTARLLKMGKPVLLQHVQRLREEGRDLPFRHQVAA